MKKRVFLMWISSIIFTTVSFILLICLYMGYQTQLFYCEEKQGFIVCAIALVLSVLGVIATIIASFMEEKVNITDTLLWELLTSFIFIMAMAGIVVAAFAFISHI